MTTLLDLNLATMPRLSKPKYVFQPAFGYAQHPKAGQNTQQPPSLKCNILIDHAKINKIVIFAWHEIKFASILNDVTYEKVHRYGRWFSFIKFKKVLSYLRPRLAVLILDLTLRDMWCLNMHAAQNGDVMCRFWKIEGLVIWDRYSEGKTEAVSAWEREIYRNETGLLK